MSRLHIPGLVLNSGSQLEKELTQERIRLMGFMNPVWTAYMLHVVHRAHNFDGSTELRKYQMRGVLPGLSYLSTELKNLWSERKVSSLVQAFSVEPGQIQSLQDYSRI